MWTRKQRGAGGERQPAPGAYLRPYVEAVDQVGVGFEATLWSSREYQQTRFRVMSEMVDLRGKTIIDAGCAHGDFAKHLLDAGVSYEKFAGIEGVPELLEQAQQAQIPRSVFLAGDFVADERVFETAAATAGLPNGRADVIAFSGSLNTLDQADAMRVLGRAWDACGVAIVFNFLSNRCDSCIKRRSTGPARRFDTMKMLDWALRKTPTLRFRQDYFKEGHDATVAMLKA